MNFNFTSYGLRLLVMLFFCCQMAFGQEKPVLCGTRDADAPPQMADDESAAGHHGQVKRAHCRRRKKNMPRCGGD
ncbi:hypothetical protein [Dyadobacter alkalitolerans]|uniref:hypothetical protein n=1 Tax=Dyadobacter alkalitolerans TaxID=492736 RepID=UPI0012FCAB37|nr:hypothetical protein [Dyadobacter alkalitolerans]